MDELKHKICKSLKSLAQDKEFVQRASQLSTEQPTGKSHELSDVTREKGNELLAKGNLDNLQLHKILHLYNESIANAPFGSEGMAKAHANKSALLLHMRRYKEAMSEAEKALTITQLIPLRVKLLCRKVACLTALGLSSENRSCLERARYTLNKSEDAVMKESLKKFIEKAQLVVDEQKLDIPKENKRMAEVSKIIADEDGKGIWKSVEVKHSEKYGNHLVATHDLAPGEIILVEKTYFYHLKKSRMYQYCCKCFKYLWTAVPCDLCCWRLFCSEECKTEAWKQYHELECSFICKMKTVFPHQCNNDIQFALSIFFKALKEAGAIDELQTNFESTQQESHCGRTLDHKMILALKTRELTKAEMETRLNSSVLALLCLAKFTPIFKKSYDFNEIEKLRRNDAAFVVGCMLLKFSAVVASDCATIFLRDPSVPEEPLKISISSEPIKKNDDNENHAINIMTMMTLVGCIPNVEASRTIGNKFVMFALHPIKAGTPLTMYHRSSSYNHATPKPARQSMHQKYYKSPCYCRACTENWNTGFLGTLIKVEIPSGLDGIASERFLNELSCITTQLSSHVMHGRKPNYPDTKAATRVKNLAAEAWKLFSLPSHMLILSTNLLVCILNEYYDLYRATFTHL